MKIITKSLSYSSRGDTDIIDVTDDVQGFISSSGLQEGQVTLFVTGSTAGITSVEYEPGLTKDLKAFFDRIIPKNIKYHHDAAWHDGNGYSHVRASLLGASFTVPFKESALLLGTWQQIVLVDFDNRPRTRKIIAQVMGE